MTSRDTVHYTNEECSCTNPSTSTLGGALGGVTGHIQDSIWVKYTVAVTKVNDAAAVTGSSVKSLKVSEINMWSVVLKVYN